MWKSASDTKNVSILHNADMILITKYAVLLAKHYVSGLYLHLYHCVSCLDSKEPEGVFFTYFYLSILNGNFKFWATLMKIDTHS